MPKVSSSGSPRLHSPGLGASSHHIKRWPSPLNRSTSQTTTELEGHNEQRDDVAQISVVARVEPQQPPSTDSAPGCQSFPSMDAMDSDPPIPFQSSQLPSAPQSYSHDEVSNVTGRLNQTQSQAPQAYSGPTAFHSVDPGYQAPHTLNQPQSWSQSQGKSPKQISGNRFHRFLV